MALPLGEVRVSSAEEGQRGLAPGNRVVELAQLPVDHPPRPGVFDDVVSHQQEHMLRLAGLGQAHPPGRAGLQIEGPAHLEEGGRNPIMPTGRISAPPPEIFEIEIGRPVDALELDPLPLAVARPEGGLAED